MERLMAKTPRERIKDALVASRGTYRFRSGPGLAHEVCLPLEHVEAYLIGMAQEEGFRIGLDQRKIIWVEVPKA